MAKPLVLIVLDGWGVAKEKTGNAIEHANLPNYKRYLNSYPHTLLSASGEAVGLPSEDVGNTEVGHLNLGAGRIVYQDLLRINMAILDGGFFQNPALLKAIDHVKTNRSKLHIIGLIGEGKVHASNDHLFALVKLCRDQTLTQVFLHLFTDGRDSPPTSALYLVHKLEEYLQKTGVGEIASIIGRYYGMDRDNRIERTKKALDLIVNGIGEKYQSARGAVEKQYANDISDEFIPPIVLTDKSGTPKGHVGPNDAAIIFNFRIDRPRQITKALLTADIKNFFLATMTEYERNLPFFRVAFPPTTIINPLGAVLETHGIPQLHIAETEKERFVTYYFNGQREEPFRGEDRLIVPSAKVPTYDQKPEMSAFEITDALIRRLESAIYGFVLVNFANADMVGHTGVFDKTVEAVEAIDSCLGKIVPKVLAMNGTCIITADHGKAEQLGDVSKGQVITEHTKNLVPALFINNSFSIRTIPMGILADIAPTCLALLGIPKPVEMTGENLFRA